MLVLAVISVSFCAEIICEVVPLEREGVKLHLECMKSDKGGEPLSLVQGLVYSSHEFDVNYKDYSCCMLR